MMETEALRELLYTLGSDDADIPFWQAAERGEFIVQRCAICERRYWPASLCVEHGNRAMEWVPASGRGTVHTYVIMRHAYTPDMAVPYNVSVIQLDEGPFYHSNVIDCPPEEMRSGMKVTVDFKPHSNGLNLPVFRRIPEES